MKVLLVGSGGREHAIAWKIKQSPKLDKLYIAPGNAGTQSLGINLNISDTDIDALLNFAKERDIDLTIVGPEAPLASGIVDVFSEAKLPIFGPRAAAARLESSKSFAKKVMKKWDIPTASYTSFDEPLEAIAYIDDISSFPTVVKADGYYHHVTPPISGEREILKLIYTQTEKTNSNYDREMRRFNS